MAIDVGLQNIILIAIAVFAVFTFFASMLRAARQQTRRANIMFSLSTIPLILVLLEIGLRVMLGGRSIQPIFNVLYLEPHPNVGWIHPANVAFEWRGFYPTCIEFDTQIGINQWGFRDEDWTKEKPEGVTRIAFIGDSLVEAFQVEKPASALLQEKLSEAYPDQTFEVMNFGVSNYSVAQFQLMYEHIAREFEPDYVVVLVAYFHMRRTPQQYPESRNAGMSELRVRPIYTLEDGELEFVPAQDYDAYVARVEKSLRENFGDNRTTVISPGMTIRLFQLLRGTLELPTSIHPPEHPDNPDAEFSVLELNDAILAHMADQVHADGAQLIFADIFDYFESFVSDEPGSGRLTTHNREFAETHDIGYVELSPSFREADRFIKFPCDGHLTPLGNELFAEGVFEWFLASGF